MSEFFSCYTFRKDVSTRAFEYASFFFFSNIKSPGGNIWFNERKGKKKQAACIEGIEKGSADC